jgi:hypothetical protein
LKFPKEWVPKVCIKKALSFKFICKLIFLFKVLLENIVCTFDQFSNLNTNLCGGLNFDVALGTSYLTGLQIDYLPSSKSTFITDYTSISKYKYKNQVDYI